MGEPRSVLITGCSSGIGKEVALGLQQRGYRVFASARKREDLEDLRQAGLEAVQLDLANQASILQAVNSVLASTNGKLFGLFNNAAYGQPGAVEDISVDALREQFEVNVFGTHELTRLVLPVMREQGYGRVIQNSSVLGLVALQYRGAYTATKFALEALTDTLRQEFAGTGIYFSLIEPGPVISNFRQNSHKAFLRHIDKDNSVHRDTYQSMEQRLLKEGPAVPFTVGPDAVLKKVIYALESKRPQIRYYVTFPTYLFGYLKRLLPARVLDALLRQV